VVFRRGFAAHDHAVAESGRTAKRDMPAKQAAAACGPYNSGTCSFQASREQRTDDDVVADLHQVVHLGVVTDARVAPGATVDACVGAELDAVTQHHAALLRFLGQLASRTHQKAEAVCAKPHAVVQRAARSDSGVRQRAPVADKCSLAQDDPRSNHAARAHATPGCNARPGKHDRAGLYYRARIDCSIAVHQPAAVGPGSAKE